MKGFDVLKDPSLSSIAYAMQLNAHINLKKKAKILLPDSCVLIGIIDPTETLEADEVFLQIKRDNYSSHNHGYGLTDRSNRMEDVEILN